MGSHDLRVANQAAELFKKGKAKFIVCTGGFGKITKSLWGISEAEKYADICIQNGVPEDKIIIENKSSNSGENFIFSKKILEEKEIKVNSGLIVSKTYLSRRAIATAKKQWSQIDWFIESPQIVFEKYFNDEVPFERMVNLMVGDLQRLKTYSDKGFQVSVDIPEDINKAYLYLISRGYTEFLD